VLKAALTKEDSGDSERQQIANPARDWLVVCGGGLLPSTWRDAVVELSSLGARHGKERPTQRLSPVLAYFL
jgi:hypothetical protein